MNRSLIIVAGALALGATLFGGSYFLSRRVCMACEAPPDDLAWLRKEFHLNAAETARIQALHKRYLVECDGMCRMVAAKKREVETALRGMTNVNPVVEKKLAELANCRAQCQSRMLQYFVAVSRVMPPEEGRRYLAEMKKLCLDLHEAAPPAASAPPGHERSEP